RTRKKLPSLLTTHYSLLTTPYPYRLHHKGIAERDLFETRKPARSAAVASFKICLEHDRVFARVELAQASHPFCRLPVGYARVGEPRERQDDGIGLRAYVVIRGIGGDRLVIFLACDRIAPFGPLGRGER